MLYYTFNSETNFQAYKFTNEYSSLRLIASCPFQVYFTGNHYYYDPNMLTDISYSTSLSNSLEQTINSIVSDIYYWGKNFPSISNTIIDLDKDQHDDSFKTTVTHTINQPTHTIVDINQTDDNTQLSSSDSDRPNIQTGNDDNEEIIDSLNIDDEDNRLLVVTGDKIRTVDNGDDTTLQILEDLVELICQSFSSWKNSNSVSKYRNFIKPESFLPILQEMAKWDESTHPRYGIELNAGCGLMSYVYYNKFLNYNMICFEHSLLTYKQLIDTQYVLVNETTLEVDPTRSRFFKNDTLNETASAETVISKLGKKPNYIQFVSFFKDQYSKSDIYMIIEYLTTIQSLVHIITDVDKSVWSVYFNTDNYSKVIETVYPLLHCVVGTTNKVYYLQLKKFKKAKHTDQSFKVYNVIDFPTSNDGSIALLNIQTELNTDDKEQFKTQLIKIHDVLADRTKRAAKDDGNKKSEKKYPKSSATKRRKKKPKALNQKQESEMTTILRLESKQINTWIDGVVSKMGTKPDLLTADSDAVLAKIVATILEQVKTKVNNLNKQGAVTTSIGSKRKNITDDSSANDDDASSSDGNDASSDGSSSSHTSDAEPESDTDDDAVAITKPSKVLDETKSTSTVLDSKPSVLLDSKILPVKKKDRLINEKCGYQYCNESTGLIKCKNCPKYFCEAPSNLHSSKHGIKCLPRQCKLQSSSCDDNLTYCRKCQMYVCEKHKRIAFHFCGQSLSDLEKKKDRDHDDSNDDDQNPTDKKRRKNINEAKTPEKKSNIAEYKTPDKSSKATTTTTSKIVANEDYTITDRDYTAIAALVTSNVDTPLSEVKRISRFKSSTSNRVVVVENHDNSPIQLKSKPIPFFRYQIHLPTNYKPFKISDMSTESKTFKIIEQNYYPLIGMAQFYDKGRDHRYFQFREAKTRRILTTEIVVTGNNESSPFKMAVLQTFHLSDWNYVNEILILLLHYYESKKFERFTYVSVRGGKNDLYGRQHLFINKYFDELVNNKIMVFCTGEFSYVY